MLFLIMYCALEVADRRMTTALQLVLAQAFVSGSTSLVRQLMGNRETPCVETAVFSLGFFCVHTPPSFPSLAKTLVRII